MSSESVPTAFGRPHGADVGLLSVVLIAISTSGPLMAGITAPALAIAFWRTGLAALILAVIAGFRRSVRLEIATMDRREIKLTVGAGLLLAVHFATWVPSLTLTSVASATAICCAQPVWNALIARYEGARIHRLVWVGMVVSLLGVGLLTGIDFSLSGRAVLGDLLALIGGASAAAYMSLGSKARRTMTTGAFTTVCYSTCAASLLLVCLVGGVSMVHYSAGSWIGILAVTGGAQFLGHALIARVLRSTDPTFVSLVVLFEVPGAAILAAIFLHQHPRWTFIPAAALLVGGIVTVLRASAQVAPVVD